MKGRRAHQTPATVAASHAGIDFTVHRYDHDAPSLGTVSYGKAAAEAMGAAPEQVLKTLLARVDGVLTVACVPVSGTLDMKALAAVVAGKKAEMAAPEEAERATGYVRGGISPLGQRRRLRTVVDASALSLPTIFVSAGRRGLQLELAPADLVRLTGAVTADLIR